MARFEGDFDPLEFMADFMVNYSGDKPEELGLATLHNQIARKGFDILKGIGNDLPPQIGMAVVNKATRQADNIGLVEDEPGLKGIRRLLEIELTSVIGMTQPEGDEIEDGDRWKVDAGLVAKHQDSGLDDLAPIHAKIGKIDTLVRKIGDCFNNRERPYNLTGVNKFLDFLVSWAYKPVERQPGDGEDEK